MAFLYKDRVKDTTTSTGTGSLTLANSAPTGYQTLAGAGIANNDTFFYCVEGGAEWEVGKGTYSTTGPSFARTEVLASSNSGNAVNFSAGTKNVFMTVPAKAVGVVANSVYAEYTSNTSITATIPVDDTIPQNTEGTEVLTASITPSSVTSRVRVTFAGFMTSSGAASTIIALFQDSTSNAICAWQNEGGSSERFSCVFEHVPATTSAVTYKIRAGVTGGNLRFNGTAAARLFGGVARATLILEEIIA